MKYDSNGNGETVNLSLRTKTFIKVFLSLLVLGAMLVLFSSHQINSASKGKVFSEIETVAHNRVGVVLGCAKTLTGGRKNLYFQYRIQAAAELFKHAKVDYLIVSGDNSRLDYDEPTDMKEALIEKGIPEDRIYCDYAGFRTLDSIVRAKAIFDCDQVTIISQEFHNKRALFIAKHKGVNAIAYNASDIQSIKGLKTSLREQLAKIKAVMDIYLLNTQPKFFGPKVEIAFHGS